jgi:hypothetical protein
MENRHIVLNGHGYAITRTARCTNERPARMSKQRLSLSSTHRIILSSRTEMLLKDHTRLISPIRNIVLVCSAQKRFLQTDGLSSLEMRMFPAAGALVRNSRRLICSAGVSAKHFVPCTVQPRCDGRGVAGVRRLLSFRNDPEARRPRSPRTRCRRSGHVGGPDQSTGNDAATNSVSK